MKNIEEVVEKLKDVENLSNKDLTELMDHLQEDFTKTKQAIIDLTYHLDNVEILYNKINKEYERRF